MNAVEAMDAVQREAYKSLSQAERSLPNRFRVDHEDIEVANYELCENDVGIADIDGFTSFGVSFYAGTAIPNATAKQLRDVVASAYAAAAAKLGKPEVSMRFIRAERQNVLRVTETHTFDLEAAEPPPEAGHP